MMQENRAQLDNLPIPGFACRSDFVFFEISRIFSVLYLVCYPVFIFIPLGMHASNEIFFTKNSLLSPCHGATVYGTGLLAGLNYEGKVVKVTLSIKDLSCIYSQYRRPLS